MSITQTATTSFKVELFEAIHNFGPILPNTFYIALYTAAADINASTTVYTATGETTGTGYTAGGKPLTVIVGPTAGPNTYGIPTAYVGFANVAWPAATFTARGALIYNATQGNKSVAVLDFGADKTVSGVTFEIVFPTADANSAIVRIA